MRRLLLLRHAKSDWSMNLPDDQRQLSPRGRAAAPVMGQYMAEYGLVPHKVLCSPAVRAAETWIMASKALPSSLKAEYVEDLYDFSTGASFIDVIRKNGGKADTLLLVGHNPSMEGLAHLLCSSGDEWGMIRMDQKYPTAALAVIDLPIDDWQDLAPQIGHLERFIRPKDVVG